MSTVSDFMENGRWKIPPMLSENCHEIVQEIMQTFIVVLPHNDELVWSKTETGSLSFKDSYIFLNPVIKSCSWGKLIWSIAIPPSRSFLLWRILHNRMPTDEHLQSKGCTLVSVCPLCMQDFETTAHIFLNCSYATNLWNWLSIILRVPIDHSSFSGILAVIKRQWSMKLKDVVLSAVIHILWAIWSNRNLCRFENKFRSISGSITLIKKAVKASGNLSHGHMLSAMEEFSVLKPFSITCYARPAPSIKEIEWKPPMCNWMKCNTDEAAHGSLGNASCGGILSDYRAVVADCFAANLGICTSLFAELSGGNDGNRNR